MSPRNGAIRAVYLAFPLIGLSCAAVSQLNLLTTQQEVEIGRQAAREVEREVNIYRDPVVFGLCRQPRASSGQTFQATWG